MKEQLEKKDKEIEELIQTNLNGSAPSFTAPVIKQENKTSENKTAASNTNKNTDTKNNNKTSSTNKNSTDKKTDTASSSNDLKKDENVVENQPVVDENEEVFE